MNIMYNHQATYRAAFAVMGYSVHPESEFRYQYCCDFIESFGSRISSVVDIGAGRGTFLARLLSERPDLKLYSVDVDRFHNLEIPHASADLCTFGGCATVRSLRYDIATCTDVLEHLPESWVGRAIDAIADAADNAAVTVANHSDMLNGVELHLTQRPIEWWRRQFAVRYEILSETTEYDGRLYAFRLRQRRRPKCSIVMSTYNKATLLELSLRSIRAQTPPFDYEIVVVDDGSTDNTQAVCEKYGTRYSFLPRPFYSNPARARNLSLRLALADIVIQQCEVIHDSPDSVEKLTMRLEPGHVDFASVWDVAVDAAGFGCPQREPFVYLSGGPAYSGLDNPRPLFFLGVVLKSDLFAIGGHDEDFVYPGYEDTWLADCLIRGRGLQPRHWGDVIGYHLRHPRPAWIDAVHEEMRRVYEAKIKAGIYCAAGGPWSLVPLAHETNSCP